MQCERCRKRLSRKTARLIEGKVLCSTCIFAPVSLAARLRSDNREHTAMLNRLSSDEAYQRHVATFASADTQPKAGDVKQAPETDDA